MNLSELWEMVMDREAWHAAIHGITKSQTRLSDWTELNWGQSLAQWQPDHEGNQPLCIQLHGYPKAGREKLYPPWHHGTSGFSNHWFLILLGMHFLTLWIRLDWLVHPSSWKPWMTQCSNLCIPVSSRKHGNCVKTKVSASCAQVLLRMKEKNGWERGERSLSAVSPSTTRLEWIKGR